MTLWAAWIMLDSAVISVSLPDITDKKFIDECVMEHNKARSSVTPAASDMLYMVSRTGTSTSSFFKNKGELL